MAKRKTTIKKETKVADEVTEVVAEVTETVEAVEEVTEVVAEVTETVEAVEEVTETVTEVKVETKEVKTGDIVIKSLSPRRVVYTKGGEVINKIIATRSEHKAIVNGDYSDL